MGTCSFVHTVNSTGRTFHYLVTAKHVVEGLSKAGGPAFLRINKGRVGEYNKGVIDVQIPINEGWLYHAEPDVDLAVLPNDATQTELKSLKVDTYHFLSLKLESLFTARAKAPMWPPGEAEPVIFIAMTTQFQGEEANLPTVRRGHLALVTDEPIKGEYGHSQYYVIEAQVYPGNSGAPVWVELTNAETKESGLYALGVLVFSYPAAEELMKVKSVENAYYNLGLSLVVPIEKLAAIVDSKDEKDRRESIKGPGSS